MLHVNLCLNFLMVTKEPEDPASTHQNHNKKNLHLLQSKGVIEKIKESISRT